MWRIFPPILLPIFLAVVDGTIVAAALPAMAGAFGEVERLSWVVASYLLASTVAAPVYGRLGDAFGRRRLLLVALVLFVVASVLCALAQGILSLTAARVLQGFGGGGLMVLSQALLGENVPRRQLGRAQGILAAVIVASSTFGPVAGGVLTQFFGWPSVFLINLPLGAVAMLLVLRLPAHAARGKRGGFDWAGLLLFAGFVVPLLLALEQMQRLDAAMLLGIVASLGVSLPCLVLLLRFERRAAQPLFPLEMLRRPAMWRANAMAACSGALLVSEVTLLPIHLQAVDGASAARIGLLMLPLTATVGMGSLVTGWLVTRTGRLAIFPAIGQTAAALGLLLVAFGHHQVGAALGPWGLPAMLALVAVFQGSAMPVAQVTAQALAPPAMLGAAAASVQLSRSVGSAVGVTLVIGALFAILSQDGATAAVFAQMVQHGPAALAGLPDAIRATTAARIDSGFSVAFIVVAAFAVMNALFAWTLPLRRI
ncbi:MFS transporter [Pseudoroseomonas ludipueritiae]|uniref:MFS transporter n=1 Tax=Pseudoroseomonas ludipueritiae TaxID=198093 RepID=A0ABR7R1P8_9PROT|nr:MFS transporter [Pseudoroseomonas ludipueritiae]MBC9175655.1 MFS transporter [Pseudoroseomonas ludipueritiae]